MFELVVFFLIRIVSKTCTVVFNVSYDHEIRCVTDLKHYSITSNCWISDLTWHHTHGLFYGPKFVGLTYSFQMSMRNNDQYVMILSE